MALTGTFQADFSQFSTAVDKAVVQLKGFEAGAGKVENALNRASESLSGTKIVQQATIAAEAVERIGGVSKLTEAELSRVSAMATEAANKLRAMGQDVPAGIQRLANATRGAAQATESWTSWLGKANMLLGAFGVSLSVGALVSFGRALLNDADALTKLHDKTEISIEGLQALRIAGDDAGVSLDSMTTAVNMLQKRLGGDDNSVNTALKDMGINIQSFKRLDGAQQMSAISDAVKGMHDPLRVANDLSALFGKGWAEQLPVLKRGFEELKDGTSLMSATTVKTLDDIGDAFGRLYRNIKGGAAEGLGIAFDAATMGALSFNQQLKEMTAAVEKGTKDTPRWTLAMRELIPPGLPKDLDALNKAWDDNIALMKAATELAVALKAAQAIEQGQGKASGLLGMLADEQQSTQASMEAWSVRNDAILKAEAALHDEINKQTLSSTNYQINKIWEVAAAEKDAFHGSIEQRVQFNAAVEHLAQLQADVIIAAAQRAAKAVVTTWAPATTAMFAGLPSLYQTAVPLLGRTPGEVGTPGSLSQRGGLGISGGGTTAVHIDVSGVWDPATIRQITAAVSEQLMTSSGRKWGSA